MKKLEKKYPYGIKKMVSSKKVINLVLRRVTDHGIQGNIIQMKQKDSCQKRRNNNGRMVEQILISCLKKGKTRQTGRVVFHLNTEKIILQKSQEDLDLKIARCVNLVEKFVLTMTIRLGNFVGGFVRPAISSLVYQKTILKDSLNYQTI